MLADAAYKAHDASLAVEMEKKALALLPGNSEQKKLLAANLAKFSAGPEREHAK